MNEAYEAARKEHDLAVKIEVAAWSAWDRNPLDPANKMNHEAAVESRKRAERKCAIEQTIES